MSWVHHIFTRHQKMQPDNPKLQQHLSFTSSSTKNGAIKKA
jgi:hypothetical protein